MTSSRRRFVVSLLGVSAALLGACVGPGITDYMPPAFRAPVPPLEDELRLVTFGDWGDGGEEQIAVARAMDRLAGQIGGFHGGLMLGDNFYTSGVSGVDDSKWNRFFAHLYDTEQLGKLPWFVVLGNHDYEGDEEAQIQYTAMSAGRWNMPAHYFRKDFVARNGTNLLTVLAIDTNEDFGDWDGQLRWLEKELSAQQGALQPTVVIGHHTIISYAFHGTTEFVAQRIDPLLQRYRPLAYLCGHDHNLQLNESGNMLYAVLGGGGRDIRPVTAGPSNLFGVDSYGFGVLRVSRTNFSLELHDTMGRSLSHWSRSLAPRS